MHHFIMVALLEHGPTTIHHFLIAALIENGPVIDVGAATTVTHRNFIIIKIFH